VADMEAALVVRTTNDFSELTPAQTRLCFPFNYLSGSVVNILPQTLQLRL